MSMIYLTRRKVQALMTIFNNPLKTELIGDLERMYREILRAIGNKGRLNNLFMVDVDRRFSGGIYTSILRLAIKIDDEHSADVGIITGVELRGTELRIDVKDGSLTFAVILMVEDV